MAVHVRVITPITTRGFRKLDDLKSAEGPDLTVSHAEIDTGPASIECETDDALAVPGTLVKLVEAERDGVDAAVIDCMADPGLKPGREMVRIPVLGPGQTAMHLAALLGHRFTVLTVLARLRYQFEDEARRYGLETSLASVRSVDVPVLELEDDIDRTQNLLAEQALRAVRDDQADAIIFGCTGMLGCAAFVREALLAEGHDIPVIDPVPTAIQIAAALVRSGLSHSKEAYADPLAKPVVGYPLTLGPRTAEAAE